MLIAIDKNKARYLAPKTERSDKIFYCPECKAPVTLKKGALKIHHFAHKTEQGCIYGAGESEIHYQAKIELAEELEQYNHIKFIEIERRLKGCRPDVSFSINGKMIAIELQRSNITIEEVERRTQTYTKLGVYLLWLIPGKTPKCAPDEHGDDGAFVVGAMEKYFHSLYYGRCYYWLEADNVMPLHFEDYILHVPWSDWGGGYYKSSKRWKYAYTDEKGCRKISSEFAPRRKKAWGGYPEALVFMDTSETWWKTEQKQE